MTFVEREIQFSAMPEFDCAEVAVFSSLDREFWGADDVEIELSDAVIESSIAFLPASRVSSISPAVLKAQDLVARDGELTFVGDMDGRWTVPLSLFWNDELNSWNAHDETDVDFIFGGDTFFDSNYLAVSRVS